MPLIHNAGRQIGEKKVARKIIYPKDWDENGHPVKDKEGKGKKILQESINPGEHKTVTEKQFAHLKALFPTEIVNLDDLKDMQRQFQSAAVETPRTGYVAPDEVDALVAKRVAEELAKKSRDVEDAKSPGDTTTEGQKVNPLTEERQALIAKIDNMDRGDLIAYIDQEGLDVEYKNYKQMGSLKSAVLSATDKKKTA